MEENLVIVSYLVGHIVFGWDDALQNNVFSHFRRLLFQVARTAHDILQRSILYYLGKYS
jgi:hypothetical protein